MPCLILSIDGGGLRGIIPVLILKHIEQKVQASNKSQRKLVTYFNLITGTSTGGLIACGMSLAAKTDSQATKYDLDFIEKVYRAKGKIIFPFKGRIGNFIRNCHISPYLFIPQFGKKGLNSVLNELFQSDRISDCITPILLTTYNVEANEPFYFSSRKALDKKHKNLNYKLVDICRATSAGPTYLPAHMLWEPKRMICVDGGVFQNNPTTSALVEVIKYPKLYSDQESIELKDIFVLSIGTGRYNQPIAGNNAFNGGTLSWLKPIIDISMWGNSQAVDRHVDEVLKLTDEKRHYLRLNVNIYEKKYADMAICTDDAMKYYTDRVTEDFLNNTAVQGAVDQWLTDSGIIS